MPVGACQQGSGLLLLTLFWVLEALFSALHCGSDGAGCAVCGLAETQQPLRGTTGWSSAAEAKLAVDGFRLLGRPPSLDVSLDDAPFLVLPGHLFAPSVSPGAPGKHSDILPPHCSERVSSPFPAKEPAGPGTQVDPGFQFSEWRCLGALIQRKPRCDADESERVSKGLLSHLPASKTLGAINAYSRRETMTHFYKDFVIHFDKFTSAYFWLQKSLVVSFTEVSSFPLIYSSSNICPADRLFLIE